MLLLVYGRTILPTATRHHENPRKNIEIFHRPVACDRRIMAIAMRILTTVFVQAPAPGAGGLNARIENGESRIEENHEDLPRPALRRLNDAP
jgi:hypothetical protein